MTQLAIDYDPTKPVRIEVVCYVHEDDPNPPAAIAGQLIRAAAAVLKGEILPTYLQRTT